MNVPIYCDNTSAINIIKNLTQHSRTKHIDVHNHFIRDQIEKSDVSLEFVTTNSQLVDIFVKLLSDGQFNYIRLELGMLNIDG